MKSGKIIAALATLGLIASPVAAQAASAEREASDVSISEGAGGSAIAWVAVAIVAAGVLVILLDDDDDDPESP